MNGNETPQLGEVEKRLLSEPFSRVVKDLKDAASIVFVYVIKVEPDGSIQSRAIGALNRELWEFTMKDLAIYVKDSEARLKKP